MASLLTRIALSIVLPIATWLVFGGPPLTLLGNLALCAAALAMILGVIWHDVIARAIGSDLFTYKMVSLAINALFVVIGLKIIAVMFRVNGPNGFESPSDVPGLAWGALLVLLLMSWIVLLLTYKRSSRLPRQSDRREFEVPAKE